MAGGCDGRCGRSSSPLKSTEFYDISQRIWQKTKDLPVPLSSASMQLLSGLPTIVGGVNGNSFKQNAELYQYDLEKDEWRTLPNVQLRIPRSSAAVFQVPKELFPHC